VSVTRWSLLQHGTVRMLPSHRHINNRPGLLRLQHKSTRLPFRPVCKPQYKKRVCLRWPPKRTCGHPFQSLLLCAQFDKCRLRENAVAAVRGGKMARRENCVHCLIATAANQPTGADYCRQRDRSMDLVGVSTVDMDVLVSAVTETLYDERCN
jgi:hypothetical protein